MNALESLPRRVAAVRPPAGGQLVAVRGGSAIATGLELPIGALVEIETDGGFVPAEVIGFRDGALTVMPLEALNGAAAGSRVWPLTTEPTVPADGSLLGRVVDALGRPLDDGPPLRCTGRAPLQRAPIAPLARPLLSEPLDVGVRSINAALTLARGQRMGLFAGAGVGKSTLLGMMVRGTNADVVVVGLIGERGREVREFVEREIGDARQRTVVVAVPSDSPPLLRVRGAHAATAIAEHFRDQGLQVLLLVDSLTRFAYAAREIGLARGEPATTRGYTPNVFSELPRLLERAGRTETGSITGLYTVLVEGDDLEDPVADHLRALLDGHIVLSRERAERGAFPAVDVLASVSRAMDGVSTQAHRQLATELRRLLAAHRDAHDLIQVGAYAKGSDAVVDRAIARRDAIEACLCQARDERVTLPESLGALELAVGAGGAAA